MSKIALPPHTDVEALAHFHAGVAAIVRDPRWPDLSVRQLDVLLTVHAAPPLSATVRGLSALLGINKPAVTRAIDRLSELHFVRRVVDQADRRSIFVELQPDGARFIGHLLQGLGKAWGSAGAPG